MKKYIELPVVWSKWYSIFNHLTSQGSKLLSLCLKLAPRHRQWEERRARTNHDYQVWAGVHMQDGNFWCSCCIWPWWYWGLAAARLSVMRLTAHLVEETQMLMGEDCSWCPAATQTEEIITHRWTHISCCFACTPQISHRSIPCDPSQKYTERKILGNEV